MKYLLPAMVAVLALGWLAGPSEARMRMHAMKPATPEQFIQKVANANEFEIQSSRLALDKSKNDEIRRFAQRMIDDHTKIGDQLKSTLQQANLPQPSGQLDEQDQALLTKLKSERQLTFDRTYVAGQVKGHIQAVNLVGAYAKSGTNPALKELAAKTQPILKEHLKMAEALRTPRPLISHR